MIDYSELAVYVERLKRNDQSAFEQLYNKTQKIVYGIACSILHDEHSAEDVLQMVYTKVYLHIDQLKDNNSFISWLHIITTNTCQDLMRQESRCQMLGDTCERSEDGVEEWLRGEYLSNLLDGVMKVLPEEQRRTVYFFYYKQMTVSQIAAIDDCSVSTVKSRLLYARRTLKKALEAEERRTGDKLTLSPVTAAVSVMMSLPALGYSLSAEASHRILAAVLAAVGAAGAVGNDKAHIVADITDEGKPFIFKKWLVKIPLLSVILAVAVVITMTTLVVSSVVQSDSLNTDSIGENTSPDASDTQPIVFAPLYTYDNSKVDVYPSSYQREVYTSAADGENIRIEAPRIAAEWKPDGVASEGEYFDVPVDKNWISSLSYKKFSAFDTAALDFDLKMSWDEDWLYVYCEFVDTDRYVCTSESDEELELWHESMLQLAAADNGSSRNYQNMIVALNSSGTKRTRIDSFSRWTPTENDFSVDVTPQKNGDRVVYEVRVPFESFTARITEPGNEYRFAAVIGWGNDRMMRHTQLAEGITGYHLGTPSMFTYLTLTEAPSAEALHERYNTNDIALLNAIIDEHKLPISKASPDGSSIPEDWKGHIVFGGEENRLIMLKLSDIEVGGALDLTGFDELKLAELERASIESLDIRGLKHLEVLLCDNNDMKELNIIGASALRTLSCRDNMLTELNLTGADNIHLLYCSGNRLTELELDRQTKLRFLYCSNNLLDSLELSSNKNLGELWCECNMLTELDLSGFEFLKVLFCEHNMLDEDSQGQIQHEFYELARFEEYVIYECGCGYRYTERLSSE